MVTRKPRACSNLAREAEIIPFPSEEVTPPVTKMYLAVAAAEVGIRSGITGNKGTKRSRAFPALLAKLLDRLPEPCSRSALATAR